MPGPDTTSRDLPDHLQERVARRSGGEPRPEGEFVLYWMRVAARGHENPALDVARTVAAERGLRTLVYHAVSERYPFASDRLHAFALEGARDVSAELAEQGVDYALHVEREGHRGPHLRELAARAALVVTEEMPVPPLRVWTRRLVEAVETPVWTVDTSCVVPMPLAGPRPDRAYAFRDATRQVRRERLSRPWPSLPADGGARDDVRSEFQLPFEPVDPRSMDLGGLLAACAIDHGVGPVADTRGGSRAGYARWGRFVEQGLSEYARLRNDPLRDGASRMSAYLHWGHVSPLRIAREAAQVGGKGADKFLDELLIWRELAYAWCFRTRDVESAECLPAWALGSLREHEADPRTSLPSWETLAHARTGDRLWDACQRSLLRHGELHNNLRMTWGKQLLGWTPDAERAMQLLADLNHRYALDGRDPASYGGLWWCLGLFDGPARTEERVFGSVRTRSSSDHARRLEVALYEQRIDRPRHRPLGFDFGMGRVSPARVAVVGAGLSGLSCATALRLHGVAVDVLDKGRGYGGRTSTRRFEVDGASVRVDHGAQYFTARDRRFQEHVASWQADGVVEAWDARFVTLERGVCGEDPRPGTRWVGTPGMNALCKHLGGQLEGATDPVRFGVRATGARREGESWTLTTEAGESLAGYDFLVVALPAPQAAELLGGVADEAADFARSVEMTPCLAAWLVFDDRLEVPFDAAFVAENDAPDRALAWAARNSSKPGRDDEPETWMLHGTSRWSTERLEEDPAVWGPELIESFAMEANAELPEPRRVGTHRWRYALSPKAAPEATRFEASLGLAVAGDWCGGPRVEGAWLSGRAAAGAVLRALNLAEAEPES